MKCYFWDIETSKIECDNGEYMQVTYLSNVMEMNTITGEIISSEFFRTIGETVEYFLKLNDGIVWVHNLDYELTFLLRELENVKGLITNGKIDNYGKVTQEVIFREKHSPLSIKLEVLPHLTFRDSYALFNKSVARLGEEIGLEKLEYDYKKIRLPWDQLEEYDYLYNERDNLIVARNIYKYMKDNNFTLEQIPLTFTSFVKLKRKEYILTKFGKSGINKFYFDRNNQYDNFDFFEMVLKTYQGGLTASNIKETGKLITNGVYSIDIKSSYPFQMASRKFPFYDKKTTLHFTCDEADNFYKELKPQYYFGMFKFKNIRIKNRNYLLPISSSQLTKGFVSSDKVVFNGKLLSSSEIIIPANNIDIDVINLCYKYDSIECLEIFSTTRARQLRKEETSFLLNAFYNKETIKDKTSLEYALSKVYANSLYGVKVTTPIKSSYGIEGSEIIEQDYFDLNEKDRRNVYTNFLLNSNFYGGTLDIFSDGCYITSYARHMLIKMVCTLVDIGCHVVYSDTDSIKFYLGENKEEDIINFIESENEKTIFLNKKNIRFKQFKDMEDITEEGFNKICRLGIWEIENRKPLSHFITLGAKKYGYIDSDNKVHTTIAGCNKFKPSIAIENLSKNENIPLHEAFRLVFSCGTEFDVTASGRTTAKIEKRSREEMNYLTYRGRRINQYGGIIIDETTYTLNITINDSKLLDVLRPKEKILSININGGINYE